jgi:hypothetical protein
MEVDKAFEEFWVKEFASQLQYIVDLINGLPGLLVSKKKKEQAIQSLNVKSKEYAKQLFDAGWKGAINAVSKGTVTVV